MTTSLTTDDLKNLGWAVQQAKNNLGGLEPADPAYARHEKKVARAKYALKKLRFEHALERKMIKQENAILQMQNIEEDVAAQEEMGVTS